LPAFIGRINDLFPAFSLSALDWAKGESRLAETVADCAPPTTDTERQQEAASALSWESICIFEIWPRLFARQPNFAWPSLAFRCLFVGATLPSLPPSETGKRPHKS